MVDDQEVIRAADRLVKDVTQHVVADALEEGYSHGTVTAALLLQAYTILRLTTAMTPAARKAFFLEMAASMADVIESAAAARA